MSTTPDTQALRNHALADQMKTRQDTHKTPGEIAYDAFYAAIHTVPPPGHPGLYSYRDAWEAAARAVLTHARSRALEGLLQEALSDDYCISLPACDSPLRLGDRSNSTAANP